MTDKLREALEALPTYSERLHGIEKGPALYDGQDVFLRREDVLDALAATPTHRSYPMTNTPTLAEALRAGIDLINGDLTGAEWKRACRDFIKQATAALAAAPQPDCEEGLTRAQVGAMLDAKRLDREALVQVIVQAMLGRVVGLHMAEAIADALLARGLRLPAPETMAWAVVVDGKIVPDLIDFNKERVERWAEDEKGTLVTLAIRVVEGGDDAA